MPQTTLQMNNKKLKEFDELEEFKKKHSEAFLYFLEEYERWQSVKKKSVLREAEQ